MFDRKELNHELDSLEGNINRMCVTDEVRELSDMSDWAHMRIQQIYELNKIRIMSQIDK